MKKQIHTFEDFLRVIYGLTPEEYEDLNEYQKKAVKAHWREYR